MKIEQVGMALMVTALFAPAGSASGPDRIEGTLTVMVADYFDQHRSETKYFVRDRSGHSFELAFASEPKGDYRTGMAVRSTGRINGTRLEGADLVTLGSRAGKPSQESASPASVLPAVSLPVITPSSGVQTTLVYNLISNAPGANAPMFANDQLNSTIFASTGLSVNTYYLENSFGSVSFAGTVVGPYAVTDPTICDEPSIQAQADQAAEAAGVDVSSYPHRVYMFPSEMVNICPPTLGGFSTVGGDPALSWINTGAFSPSNSFIYVILGHELGHELSMTHSQSIQSDGSLVEYGDNSCVMGDDGYSVVDFNVLHRIQEGWIPLTNLLQVTAGGTYTVNLGETQTSQVQALQIAIPGTAGNMYVSYRQPIGEDANLASSFLGGASIHFWDGSTRKIQLATNYPWGGALTDGQTYTSPDDLVSVTQLSHDSTSVTVQVSALSPGASATVSAATFLGGLLAPATISSAFGNGLATATLAASTSPLPFDLLGTSVVAIDNLEVARPAPLYFVSPTQVNYEMPEGMAAGPAEVSVISGTGSVSVQTVQIGDVSPGLFLMDSAGLAAGGVLRIAADGTQSYEPVYQLNEAGALIPLPIDLSDPSAQVYLSLYGTGIRGAGTGGTTVTVGGVSLPVAYAGAQGTLVGLDQVNILLPPSLAGSGNVPVVLTAAGVQANAANISIK